MTEAMHAARLVAVQSALLALLFEQQGDAFQAVDGVTVTLNHEPDGAGLEVIYTHKGNPVAGEGI